MLPALGAYRRASSRATVLLPLPLSPTSAVTVRSQLERYVVDGVQLLPAQQARAEREPLREAADLERRLGERGAHCSSTR